MAGRQGQGLQTVDINVSFWGVSHVQGTTKQGAIYIKTPPDNDVIRKAPCGENSSPDLCVVGLECSPDIPGIEIMTTSLASILALREGDRVL